MYHKQKRRPRNRKLSAGLVTLGRLHRYTNAHKNIQNKNKNNIRRHNTTVTKTMKEK